MQLLKLLHAPDYMYWVQITHGYIYMLLRQYRESFGMHSFAEISPCLYFIKRVHDIRRLTDMYDNNLTPFLHSKQTDTTVSELYGVCVSNNAAVLLPPFWL